MVLTPPTYCDDNTGDHLLYSKGVFVKTGEIVNERPVYQDIENDTDIKILFKDNQWMEIVDGYILISNTQQGLTPPKRGWVRRGLVYWSGSAHDRVVHKVPITPPPPTLYIQCDSIPDIGGLYSLANTSHYGYPAYHNSEGYIAVQPVSEYELRFREYQEYIALQSAFQYGLSHLEYQWIWEKNISPIEIFGVCLVVFLIVREYLSLHFCILHAAKMSANESIISEHMIFRALIDHMDLKI